MSHGGGQPALEVSVRSGADWERAILTGYRAWNQLQAAQSGVVVLDMERGALEVQARDRTSLPER